MHVGRGACMLCHKWRPKDDFGVNSPSTLISVPGFKLSSSGMQDKHLYPLSHFTSPTIICLCESNFRMLAHLNIFFNNFVLVCMCPCI